MDILYPGGIAPARTPAYTARMLEDEIKQTLTPEDAKKARQARAKHAAEVRWAAAIRGPKPPTRAQRREALLERVAEDIAAIRRKIEGGGL